MEHKEISRADNSIVTDVLSKAFSVTLPADEDSVVNEIYPEKVDRLGFPLAELQQVEWETYPGVFGPNTLMKRVEHSTSTCSECGGEGWKDELGDVICNGCGLVLNSSPQIIAYDPENGRCNGGSRQGGRYVMFNDAGKQALNQTTLNHGGDEPDVQ